MNTQIEKLKNEILEKQQALNRYMLNYENQKSIAFEAMVEKVQELPDEIAVKVPLLYPEWKDIIGQTVEQGFKFTYDDVVYKTNQPSMVIQEQYLPGVGTESIYTRIDEQHAGTIEDPIPYSGNMELFEGLYYEQNREVYLCTRSTEIPVYHALKDLVGIYLQVI